MSGSGGWVDCRDMAGEAEDDGEVEDTGTT